MVSRIVCLMMIIGLTCGATWMGRLPMKPRQYAHKTGCYIPEIDDVIPFGEEVSPAGSCYRIECLKQRLAYASCDLISIEDESSKCYVTNGDLSRPYPDCCQQIKCEEDNYLI